MRDQATVPAYDRGKAAPTTASAGSDRSCTHCGAAPRWLGGMWCAGCIAQTCCVPWREKGRICQHQSRAIKAARRG